MSCAASGAICIPTALRPLSDRASLAPVLLIHTNAEDRISQACERPSQPGEHPHAGVCRWVLPQRGMGRWLIVGLRKWVVAAQNLTKPQLTSCS